jgi:diaminopimelate epimerase
VDFEYIIHNADGGEVEQCGNGARCFARYVHDKGLTTKSAIRVRTRSGDIAPVLTGDGRVRVDMGQPRFDLSAMPFDASDLQPQAFGGWERWRVRAEGAPASVSLAGLVSMGNPHAVLCVASAEKADVSGLGAEIQANPRFTQGVNVGFLQVISRTEVQLRVFERGAGETLACGTGACAAVVAGIRWGLLDPVVEVHTHGGDLQIAWQGADAPVEMTGPATTVFEGQLELPDLN